jgi:6-phosphogluconolactonase (cycloisomerase 2 family)
VYQIASNGALTLAPGSPFSTVPAGLEPQNMAMDGKGKFLYVMEDSIDHSGSFVVGYSVANTGLLTQIPGNWGASVPIWEMVGDPDGLFMIGITGKVQFLFGSSDKNLYVYSIDQNTGALTAAVGSPHTTINTPFNLAMQPTSSGGEFVYSFSVNDSGIGYNNIEGFQLNPGTAALTEVTGSPFAGLTPSPWGQFDPSGAFLFIYAGTSPNFTMGVLTVNSGGGLGQAVANTNLATSGYWAVADIP